MSAEREFAQLLGSSRKDGAQAILEVLNRSFPLPVTEPVVAESVQTYDVDNLAISDVIYLRHASDWDEDRNQDPEVLALMEASLGSEKPIASSSPDGQKNLEKGRGESRASPKLPAKRSQSKASIPIPASATPSSLYEHKTLGKRRGENQTPSTRPPQQRRSNSSVAIPTSVGSSNAPTQHANGSKRRNRRRDKLRDPSRKAEEYRSAAGLNAKTFRVSSSGWQGTNFNSTRDGRQLIQEWKAGRIVRRLLDFVRIPYEGLKTRVRDGEGRKWFVRTFVNDRVQKLLPLFGDDAAKVVAEIDAKGTGFTEQDMKLNSRGAHWFSIAGHDRNNKSKPALTLWHRRNEAPISWLFRRDGPAALLNKIMNQVFEQEFPAIALRYKACADTLGIKPLFGYFFNFCLNAPRPRFGIRRVHCKPHVDWKNLAIGICVIFIYGTFNSKERSWLVIWEAGIVVEMPPGVFAMYPSSLFFHFNVDMCDVEFVVTSNGELPTPRNSAPLDGGDGRGSCVWFNQASLFQTSELGFETIAAAKEAGADATSNAEYLIDAGLFPTN